MLSAAHLRCMPANQACEPSAHFPQQGCWGTVFSESKKYLMVGLGLDLGLIPGGLQELIDPYLLPSSPTLTHSPPQLQRM